jgi:hypothetical protein
MTRYILILLTFMVSNAFGEDFYVDHMLTSDCTTGNYSIASRNCTGSDGDAWGVIADSISSMQAGDTLNIRAGTYVEMDIYIGDWRSGSSENWYTIQSYPGEWAIIDAEHTVPGGETNHGLFRGTTARGQQGYIRIQNLELTGGGIDIGEAGYPSTIGAAIKMRGGPFEFRYLYIHDNYSEANNNGAGIQLENGTGETTIEYCWFKANGEVLADSRITSVSNLTIFSDFEYSDPIVLYDSGTGYTSATFSNVIRYNIFDGDAGGGNWTTTGFKHKGMQRLTGYVYADQENVADNLPNDDSYRALGDKIHHNLFINHMVGIEVDQDYVQIYQNIIFLNDYSTGPENAIQLRDGPTQTRRGPFEALVYNNTINCDGLQGVTSHLTADNLSGTTPYIKTWQYNNIVQNAGTTTDREDLTITNSGDTWSNGYPLSDLLVNKNYFYIPNDTDLIRIHNTDYTQSEIEATASADTIYSNPYNAGDLLYAGTTGSSQYVTRGAHVLESGVTIADGGQNGNHPYLAGVSIPSFVGATNPSDNNWPEGLYTDIRSTTYLKDATGDPTWVEGEAQATTSVTAGAGTSSVMGAGTSSVFSQ